jgi:NAD(P)-dependent dehydrogenase (short-subunit alcohol dehydrogenase family)
MELQSSKVVVVGGSSGIGRGVAQAALERGAEVVLVGRSPDKLRQASQALGASARVSTHPADVTREADVAELFDQVGPFEHLIVTSGIPPYAAPIGEMELHEVRAFIDVMLVGAVALAKHSRRHQRAGGSITFTSGISKDRPIIPGGALVAAVAGSFGFLARALALELGPTRVNVVSPGWVDTPMWDTLMGPEKIAAWEEKAARMPAHRIATPADIARAYVFLMESEMTTGIVLHVDGGQALV